MTSSPDQIREQIEETRTNLSEDVNTLADTVNPAQAAKRKAASADCDQADGQGITRSLAAQLPLGR